MVIYCLETAFSGTLLKKIKGKIRGMGIGGRKVSTYWMPERKEEDTGNSKRRLKIALPRKLVKKNIMDVSQCRITTRISLFYSFIYFNL